MELWIRSQDREKLLKVNDIALRKNIELIFDEITDYNINNPKIWECEIVGYFDKNTEFEILAKYHSEKRALEVLDEIQSIISPKINIVSHKISEKRIKDFSRDVLIEPIINDIQLKETSTYVYEMPKE